MVGLSITAVFIRGDREVAVIKNIVLFAMQQFLSKFLLSASGVLKEVIQVHGVIAAACIRVEVLHAEDVLIALGKVRVVAGEEGEGFIVGVLRRGEEVRAVVHVVEERIRTGVAE
jgi:hypothetical protein